MGSGSNPRTLNLIVFVVWVLRADSPNWDCQTWLLANLTPMRSFVLLRLCSCIYALWRVSSSDRVWHDHVRQLQTQKPRVSKTIFGHSAWSTQSDWPHRKGWETTREFVNSFLQGHASSQNTCFAVFLCNQRGADGPWPISADFLNPDFRVFCWETDFYPVQVLGGVVLSLWGCQTIAQY